MFSASGPGPGVWSLVGSQGRPCPLIFFLVASCPCHFPSAPPVSAGRGPQWLQLLALGSQGPFPTKGVVCPAESWPVLSSPRGWPLLKEEGGMLAQTGHPRASSCRDSRGGLQSGSAGVEPQVRLSCWLRSVDGGVRRDQDGFLPAGGVSMPWEGSGGGCWWTAGAGRGVYLGD